MIAKGRAVERLSCDGIGVGRIGLDHRDHLSTHTVNRVLVKARIDQRLVQQINRLILCFGQEFRRYGHRIAINVIAERGRQTVARNGKGTRVHVARPFLKQRAHQVHRTAFFGIVQCRAALEPDFHRNERNLGAFDQPCGDPAGRCDLLDVDIGGSGQRAKDQSDGNQNAPDHWVTSAGGSDAGGSGRVRNPVTALFRSKIMSAAAMTSSGVTAIKVSVHACTSSTEKPIANA